METQLDREVPGGIGTLSNFKLLLTIAGVGAAEGGRASVMAGEELRATTVVKVRPNAIDWTKCSAKNGRCLNQC